MSAASWPLLAEAAVVTADVLRLDWEAEVERIVAMMRDTVWQRFKRKGVVLGVSGGVDSSVCAALACRAFEPERTLALLMPEYDSSAASEDLGGAVARHLGMPQMTERIGPALEAIGCYRWRDEAIRSVFPSYADDWRNKIVIARPAGSALSYFKLVVQSPDGQMHEQRLPGPAYLQIVAATNFKQRLRKTMEYFHADRLNYAVLGTPNRLEYDQGFFVKNGDGSADVKPIAHLYKTQVYALARHLKLPDAVCNAVPTTDTYSLPQGQDEFYFSLPYAQMDLVLWGLNHGVAAADLTEATGLTTEQVAAAWRDIESKRRATAYLHARPVLAEPVFAPGTQA
jgi:NAD+ synthase